MVRVTTATTMKRTVAISSLQSHDNTNSNIHDGVSQISYVDPLKGKYVPTFKMKPQSPFFEVEDYYSKDCSALSLRTTIFSQHQAESSHTVIMPWMMIGAVNFKEDL